MALTYNSISLAYVRTEVDVAGCALDPSGTDQLYTVIKLKARGIINLSLSPAIFADGSASEVLTRVRHMMTAPRKPLYYDLDSPPGQQGPSPIISLPRGLDDANGPFPDPDAFSVSYTTQNTLEVVWSVTVKLLDCNVTGFDSDGNPVAVNPANVPLSLKWEDSIEFDKYWKATWRRNGTLILSSLSDIGIDEWRRNGLAPMVLPGFAREQAHYAISKDGLRCDFTFVDGQLRYSPPYPIIDMDITQSESLPTLDGMKHGEVVVHLKGTLNALPKDMQNWAFEIAFSRMNAAHPLAADGRAIADVVFSTKETKESIEATCVCRYRVPPDQMAENVLTNKGAAWGAIIGGVVGGAWRGATRGLWGGLVGTVAGAAVGGIVGGVAAWATAPNPQGPPTEQGRPTTRHPFLGWVGCGTGTATPDFPAGWSRWASPNGSITGPAAGVGLAQLVQLHAAALGDPCGTQLEPMPNAPPRDVDIRNVPQPEAYNTLQSGQGGDSPTSAAYMSVAQTSLLASQYPTTLMGQDAYGVFQWDGRPGAYDLWQCENEYAKNPGTLVVPTCNPSGKSVKIRYASDQYVLKRRWVASRTGSPPRLPPDDPPSDNWVLTGMTPCVRDMRVAPDGVSYIYEASGIYEYMALDSTLVTLTAEVPPYISESSMTTARDWASHNNELQANVALIGGGNQPLGGGVLLELVPN